MSAEAGEKKEERGGGVRRRHDARAGEAGGAALLHEPEAREVRGEADGWGLGHSDGWRRFNFFQIQIQNDFKLSSDHFKL
jgi:hypothetical protein